MAADLHKFGERVVRECEPLARAQDRVENEPRLCIANANVPNMVGQITTALAKHDLNIADMLNKSRGNVAYTMVDVDSDIPDTVAEELGAIEGVLSVRVLPA